MMNEKVLPNGTSADIITQGETQNFWRYTMIYFEQIPLDKDMLDELGKLHIDYVFQPIMYPDGKTIFAYEALMRPHDMTVVELIDKYKELDKLHVLEMATFFGATQAHMLRGYTEPVCINSFPSECLSKIEVQAFSDFFGDRKGLGIIEILEYPKVSISSWSMKKKTVTNGELKIALDDFGSGNNNMAAVDFFKPHIIKLDRKLISNIDKDKVKQENFINLLDEFHKKKALVVAEGVETKEEFDFLVGHGVDLLQGYYLARPA